LTVGKKDFEGNRNIEEKSDNEWQKTPPEKFAPWSRKKKPKILGGPMNAGGNNPNLQFLSSVGGSRRGKLRGNSEKIQAMGLWETVFTTGGGPLGVLLIRRRWCVVAHRGGVAVLSRYTKRRQKRRGFQKTVAPWEEV